MIRAIRSAICEMRVRFSDVLSGRSRSRNCTAFSAKDRIAISGWFSSWLMPADIWPSADSLPACTRSACARRRAACASSRSVASRRNSVLLAFRAAVRLATCRSSAAFASDRARRRSVARNSSAPKARQSAATAAACARAKRCAPSISSSTSPVIPTTGKARVRCKAASGRYGPQRICQISWPRTSDTAKSSAAPSGGTSPCAARGRAQNSSSDRLAIWTTPSVSVKNAAGLLPRQS